MPFAPKIRHTMEIIHLHPGQLAPQGADWVTVSPVLGGAYILEGTVEGPDPFFSPYDEYPLIHEAIAAALDYAMEHGCPLLYVEIDARRCARW